MANWKLLDPDAAARTWQPQTYGKISTPEPWVARVRECLADGHYQMVVAAGGQSFVGRPAEVEARIQTGGNS
jgi:hypothetical protein